MTTSGHHPNYTTLTDATPLLVKLAREHAALYEAIDAGFGAEPRLAASQRDIGGGAAHVES